MRHSASISFKRIQLWHETLDNGIYVGVIASNLSKALTLWGHLHQPFFYNLFNKNFFFNQSALHITCNNIPWVIVIDSLQIKVCSFGEKPKKFITHTQILITSSLGTCYCSVTANWPVGGPFTVYGHQCICTGLWSEWVIKFIGLCGGQRTSGSM